MPRRNGVPNRLINGITKPMDKSKIEALFPLTPFQDSLLFHHLSSGSDQGFLLVQGSIIGELDYSQFSKALQNLFQANETLRASIHWKKLKKPVVLIKPTVSIDLKNLDFSARKQDQIEQDLLALEKELKEESLDLSADPLSHLILVKIKDDLHRFYWPSHHILIDGWSTRVLFSELFRNYEGLGQKETVELRPKRSGLKQYFNRLKQQPQEEARAHFGRVFEGYSSTTLLADQARTREVHKMSNRIELSEKLMNNIVERSQQEKVSTNSFFQLCWHILLQKFLGQNDTVFGLTTSGRGLDVEDVDLLVGMFSNLTLSRGNWPVDMQFWEACQILHQTNGKGSEYESLGLPVIKEQLPDSIPDHFFDTLFVFNSFEASSLVGKKVEFSDLDCGLTSTYPFTCAVRTEGLNFIELQTNTELVSQEVLNWFSNQWERLVESKILADNPSLQEIKEDLLEASIKGQEQRLTPKAPQDLAQVSGGKTPEDLFADRWSEFAENETEAQMINLWEEVLDLQRISVQDDYFELGGSSLQALRLFERINETFDTQLNALELLEYTTIRKLSTRIHSQSTGANYKHLIPLRKSGDKDPLFCIHAGGGHVFFYQPLVKTINKKRPVYALHAGMEDPENLHDNIEEMTREYLKEMRSIQKEGVLSVVVYCFSTAIGVEMARIMNAQDEKIRLIVLDTIAEEKDKTASGMMSTRLNFFIKRLRQNPVKSLRSALEYRIGEGEEARLKRLVDENRDVEVAEIRDQLAIAHESYIWKTFSADLLLILSNYSNETRQQIIVDSWQKLNQGKTTVEKVEGNHYDLFQSPNIEAIGKFIQAFFSR